MLTCIKILQKIKKQVNYKRQIKSYKEKEKEVQEVRTLMYKNDEKNGK